VISPVALQVMPVFISSNQILDFLSSSQKRINTASTKKETLHDAEQNPSLHKHGLSA
jgi:hypothetical protein